MSYKSFGTWLEFNDVYGFENQVREKQKPKNPRDELPINMMNTDYIGRRLSSTDIGTKKGSVKFSDLIHWGEGNGALRVRFDPDYHIELGRLAYDLNGKPTWYSKKLFLMNREGYGGHEDVVVDEIIENLKRIDETPYDSPKNDWDGLEQLVSSIADSLKRVARRIFLFEGIRKVSDTNYIIRMGVRGHGVEAPDQQRVEENQTQVTYDKESGVIRITNYNIESPVGGAHEWALMPVDTNLWFLPTQPKEEIVEAIATSLRWY
jgi:hypothetical protein